MNISELVTTLKKATDESDKLKAIMQITGSDEENVVDNVTLLFENAEPTNKVKIESLIEDLQGMVSEARSEYEDAYDESQNAIGCLESVSCDLNSIDDIGAVVSEIQALIEDTDEDDGVADGLEMDSETNEQRCATKTTTIHTQP